MPQLEIPSELKASLPQTSWGKIVGATPIVMTVIATCLAGLASNEMIQAQYDRSWAAQLQSKASDEWGFFQAKRLRSILQADILELFQSMTRVQLADAAGVEDSIRRELVSGPADGARDRARQEAKLALESPEGRRSMAALASAAFPAEAADSRLDPPLQAALQALEECRSEAEVSTLLAKVTAAAMADGLHAAEARLQAFDRAVKPGAQWADGLENKLKAAGAKPSSDFKALRLRYDNLRYEAESRLDQTVAYIFELQVRRAAFTADRHRTRSGRFFYGMLGAQMAVVISTFALAARQKSLLWSFAALAGMAAVIFALYVYLYV